MKKKLLLTLAIVSMLACIFAISVSAKTVTTLDGKEVTVTTYDDAPARTNIVISTDDVVVFDDGFCCPTGYVFKDQNSISKGKWGGPSIASAFDFSYVNKKTGKTYTFDNVVELDFPQGLTTIGDYLAHKVTNLRRVSLPDSVVNLGGCTFQETSNLEECTFEHNENSGLTIISTYMFCNTAIKAISIPDCVTTIKGEAAFSTCSNLGAVYLPKSLTTIQGGAQGKATFDACNNMYFVNEPFTYDNIPEKPEVYYFPANFSSISDQCIFRQCNNLNSVMVFDTAMTSIPNIYTFQGSSNSTVVFLGNMTEVDAKYWGSVKTIYFANKADLQASDIATLTGSQTKYYCNAEGNTNHLYLVEENTAPTCLLAGVKGYACFCGVASDAAETIPALGHEKNALLAKYFAEVNGTLDYYNDMVTEHSCTRCTETVFGTEKDTALFTKKGYSYSQFDSSSFSYTIYVNADAIKSYNAELLYGIVVSANVNGAPISYLDGKISHDDKTIAIEFQNTSVAYSIITAKLTNVDATTELHMSAYCVDNGVVSYLGHDAVNEVAETISHEILLTKYPSGKEE